MLSISQITDPLVAILSIALVFYGWKLLQIFKNGRMEPSFRLFMIAPIFLAFSNIYGTLSDFDLLPDLYLKWNLQLDDLAASLFIITLFIGFVELRRAWQPKKTFLEEMESRKPLKAPKQIVSDS